MMNAAWRRVLQQLETCPRGTFLRVPRSSVLHPLDAGFQYSIGLPRGQSADFRLTLPDCRGLHVQDFGTHYEAHVDVVDPACDLGEHLFEDAPGALVASAAGLGGLAGLAVGRDGSAALVGVLVGGALGLGLLALRESGHLPSAR